MKTGTNRSNKGGGGKGGKTRGKTRMDKVNKAKTITVYPNMHEIYVCNYLFQAILLRAALHITLT